MIFGPDDPRSDAVLVAELKKLGAEITSVGQDDVVIECSGQHWQAANALIGEWCFKRCRTPLDVEFGVVHTAQTHLLANWADWSKK